ncbi:hypothetical protein DYL72_15565 [Vibrio anguillarum]|uniref:Uncharacterized protein n=3 Tax=Vibrio anguillarum TaxID=55601 RepID=A0A7U6J4V6_VIBAN|nr:hypothetical protein [Vibrio anguillarum]AZS26509.1 hypothetical protein DYL72_15565 [Vibrio anguillarum]MBF4374470.1 hypothetical protein [Vibrio anguillarum]
MQFQRIPVMKKNKKIECLNVTLAPLMDSGRGNKTANFDKKMVIQLKESGMANLAAALMGFKRNISIHSSGSPENPSKKVMYVNLNDDDTTNIIIAESANNERKNLSISFKNTERYPLLRLTASQLTLNSTGYNQTITDTLTLIKASVMR